MEDNVVNLKGSPFRDEWRFRHKQEKYYSTKKDRDRCWGLDIDFIEGRDDKPVAILDLHDEKDAMKDLTWAEKKIYPLLSKALNIPIFIVESNINFKPIWVKNWPDERFVTCYRDFEEFTQQFTEKIETITQRFHLNPCY